MRKGVGLILILFAMASIFVFNSVQPVKYIAENDGVIEWQSYDSKGCLG